MRQVTPRIPQTSKLNEMIGCVLNSNCFPTMRGRLLYIQKDKCYFEILENNEYPKYNECAGQIEYLPEHMVVCMEFELD
jgi:hypothetical protein